MDFSAYQRLAERTANKNKNYEMQRRINGAFGLVGEAGESVDVIKKNMFHGHTDEQTRDKLWEELGDVLWYLAEVASTYGLSLDGIAVNNIEKLKRRYPEGFDSQRSINREED